MVYFHKEIYGRAECARHISLLRRHSRERRNVHEALRQGYMLLPRQTPPSLVETLGRHFLN